MLLVCNTRVLEIAEPCPSISSPENGSAFHFLMERLLSLTVSLVTPSNCWSRCPIYTDGKWNSHIPK